MKYYSFIETEVFTRAIDAINSDLLDAIQQDLLLKIDKGAIVRGAGGVRKARVADKKNRRGKSGSFRYLYLPLERNGVIYMIYIFSKNERANISNAEAKEIKKIASDIKKAYRE